MAKKKSEIQSESNSIKIHHHQTMGDDSSEKLDSLKSLNAMLLKETVERRQQVDSLTQSKEDLETELNRSVMDKASLQSQMNSLSEEALVLEIEKELVSIVVIEQANQLAEVSGKEIDVFRREQVVMEEKIQSLEAEMKRILEEKSEIEKLKNEKVSEFVVLNGRLEQLMADIDNEKVVNSRVCDERDEIRAQLDARIQEVTELHLKVSEADEKEARVLGELRELKEKYARLVEENRANKRRIETITSDKELIQINLVGLNEVIDDLKRNLAEQLKQKTVIEDEKNKQERENNELQDSVKKLNDLVQSMRTEEEALNEKVADLEKRCTVSSEKEAEMQSEIKLLVEEKKEAEERIESLAKEKILVLKELQDAMKDLEHQKLKFEQIVQEKTEMEDSKIQKESEILKMKEQLSEFQETISSLENSKLDQNEKLKHLEVEFSHLKASFDEANEQKNSLQESLDEEKTISTDLKKKITVMEARIGDLDEKLGKTTTANEKLLGEKNDLVDRCASLVKEVASLETELSETCKEFDVTKGKLELAEAKPIQVLKILKKTVSNSAEFADSDQENGFKEEIKDHVTDIEAIKGVFKDKDIRIEEMKRQLEEFKNFADEAQNGKNFWTIVSSATTLLAAAVSVAYVARSH